MIGTRITPLFLHYAMAFALCGLLMMPHAAWAEDNTATLWPTDSITTMADSIEATATDSIKAIATDSIEAIATDSIEAIATDSIEAIATDSIEVIATTSPDTLRAITGIDIQKEKPLFLQEVSFAGVALIAAGIVMRSERTHFRKASLSFQPRFKNVLDNTIQYAPGVLTLGLKAAGVQGRSKWGRLLTSAALSYASMAVLVNGMKYTIRDMRPDGTSRNSFPSGHTATVFTGATILHKEYGLTRSPWYSVGGYALATATGVMRILNNRHWVSDVLSGAGIGIMSTEIGYGLSQLIFRDRHLLRPERYSYVDLRRNPSFFALSMGIGLGVRELDFPFTFYELDESLHETPLNTTLNMKLTSSTMVGAEAAWFFCPYVGVGGRLRVQTSFIDTWTDISQQRHESIRTIAYRLGIPTTAEDISEQVLIESDHLSEFTADAGVYVNYPLSRRFALGSKLLVGRSMMDGIEATAHLQGKVVDLAPGATSEQLRLQRTETPFDTQWTFISVDGNRSTKIGTGLSLTYAYKSGFTWRLFADYDYTRKTFTATYRPMGFAEEATTTQAMQMAREAMPHLLSPYESRTRKSMHTFLVGAAFCVGF